tara:strand:- start:388 stop:618 length:231 start_codon:yes stop_codon:yes gene_type:complete
MSNSPYQDALSLLKEIHEDIETLSRVSLVCPESIHDELRKFRDDLGKKIKKVDNSQAQPVPEPAPKYQGTYRGTFE